MLKGLSVRLSDKREGFGTMHVIVAEDDSDIPRIVSENGFEGLHSGVYGISARVAMGKTPFVVDYWFNSLDNCIMECVSGKDVLLIADPAMVDGARKAVGRINSLGSGKIGVDIVQ